MRRFKVRTNRLLLLLTPCLIRWTGYFWVRHCWMDDRSSIRSSWVAFRSVGGPLWCSVVSRFHSRDVLSCNGKGREGTDDSSRRDLIAGAALTGRSQPSPVPPEFDTSRQTMLNGFCLQSQRLRINLGADWFTDSSWADECCEGFVRLRCLLGLILLKSLTRSSWDLNPTCLDIHSVSHNTRRHFSSSDKTGLLQQFFKSWWKLYGFFVWAVNSEHRYNLFPHEDTDWSCYTLTCVRFVWLETHDRIKYDTITSDLMRYNEDTIVLLWYKCFRLSSCDIYIFSTTMVSNITSLAIPSPIIT